MLTLLPPILLPCERFAWSSHRWSIRPRAKRNLQASDIHRLGRAVPRVMDRWCPICCGRKSLWFWYCGCWYSPDDSCSRPFGEVKAFERYTESKYIRNRCSCHQLFTIDAPEAPLFMEGWMGPSWSAVVIDLQIRYQFSCRNQARRLLIHEKSWGLSEKSNNRALLIDYDEIH